MTAVKVNHLTTQQHHNKAARARVIENFGKVYFAHLIIKPKSSFLSGTESGLAKVDGEVLDASDLLEDETRAEGGVAPGAVGHRGARPRRHPQGGGRRHVVERRHRRRQRDAGPQRARRRHRLSRGPSTTHLWGSGSTTGTGRCAGTTKSQTQNTTHCAALAALAKSRSHRAGPRVITLGPPRRPSEPHDLRPLVAGKRRRCWIHATCDARQSGGLPKFNHFCRFCCLLSNSNAWNME